MPDEGIIETAPPTPVDAANAEQRAASRAGIDAVLDLALGGLADPDDAHEERPAGKQGKRREEPEPEQDDLEEGDDEGDENEINGRDVEDDDDDEDAPDLEDEDEDDDVDEDMRLHRAYTVLADRGIPARVLKRTPRSELIAWAERVGREDGAAAAGSPAKNGHGREAPDGAKAEREAPVAAPSGPDWATMRAGIAEKLGVSEESVDGFKHLHDTNESLRAELRDLRDTLAKDREESRAREGRATIERELRRLNRHYPGVKDDSDKSERLTEMAADLINGANRRGEPLSAQDAFNRAARALLGKARRGDLAQHRRRGVSSPPEGRGGPGFVSGDEEARWTRSVDLAFAGKRHKIAGVWDGYKPPTRKPR